ncbi:MAG: hypothetical protein HYX89_07225 [Chloroflexi bacterium]|nr:hypothetical protein [Chloroflexota bacterium]
MAFTRRVELLFDPEEYAQLEQIARGQKASVGALVRRAVEQVYLGPTEARKQAAVERIIRQRVDFGPWDELKAIIASEAAGHFEAS